MPTDTYTFGPFYSALAGCGCPDCSGCTDCPCIDAVDPPSMCVDFGAWSSGPCAGLYGEQELNPAFPTDGDGHRVNCEWIGPAAEGGCGGWTLSWDCSRWLLSSSIGSYTCAAGDFDCATGGTFTKTAGDGLPGTVAVGAC